MAPFPPDVGSQDGLLLLLVVAADSVENHGHGRQLVFHPSQSHDDYSAAAASYASVAATAAAAAAAVWQMRVLSSFPPITFSEPPWDFLEHPASDPTILSQTWQLPLLPKILPNQPVPFGDPLIPLWLSHPNSSLAETNSRLYFAQFHLQTPKWRQSFVRSRPSGLTG